MRVLALEEELPGVEPERYGPLLHDEARRLWELYQDGRVREAYFRADRTSAVLVLEVPTLGEAQAVIETLPLVREQLIRFALIPLAPYTGFARLFQKNRPE